jgi:hypothetical protein
VHGTTHEQVLARWESERCALQPILGKPAYPFVAEETRKVARDAYVSWRSSRYSVPWQYAAREVYVWETAGRLDIRCGSQRIALHSIATAKHQVVTESEHHKGIPFHAGRNSGKTLVHLRAGAPVVDQRSLAAYDSLAGWMQ